MPDHSISILSMHYPPEAAGNAPYVGALAAGLKARAHDVTAHVAHPHYPEWEVRPGYGQWRRTEFVDGVAIHRLRHYVPHPPRGLRRLLSELSFGCRLMFSRLRSESVVVAVSPALFATALVALRVRFSPSRRGLVVWVQDIYTLGMTETKEGSRFSATVTKFLESHVFRSADRVVVIHPRFADHLVQHMGVDPARVVVIRNWTHLKPSPLMGRSEGRAALGWPEDALIVLHTGNMGAKQGLENVVEAARLADERRVPLKFVLVGDGSEREDLERMAEGIDCLSFVDPLNDADYRCALAAADCLLVNELPGVAMMAVPSKLTSYFDAARPVLAATDPNGITAGEIGRAGAGEVVPAGDPSALLMKALELSQDRARADAYGVAGRRYRMEVLDEDAAITAFERVIRVVANERADWKRRRSHNEVLISQMSEES